MDKHPQANGEPIKDEQREKVCKEGSEVKPSKLFSDRLLPHILNIYGSSATARDFEIYAPDATFEDPLMCANGIKQIKSAFYSLPKIFSESRIVEYNIKENEISPSKQEILIDNKQYYKFLGKGIDMISLIKLYVEDGKIIRHEDWYKKAVWWFEKTLAHIPSLSGMWEPTVINLAHALRKLKWYREAITYYEKALALSTRSLSTYAGLAYTYHLQDNFTTAITYYHKALWLKPDDQFCTEMLTLALADECRHEQLCINISPFHVNNLA